MTSVSIIIPCYNYAHYLRGCTESVLSQPGVDIEVLIIDDCSSDDTAILGEELAADPRVSFRRHEVNQGHIATYNEGLEWASADCVALLSADDLLTPGALMRAATAMDAYPSAGFVYGRSVYFESNDALPPSRVGAPEPQLWKGQDWIAQRCKTATSSVSSPEVVVRNSMQRRLGGYRPELPHTADVEMWLRLAAHGDVVYLRQVDQAYYRRHPDSMLRSAAPMTDIHQRKAAFDALFAHNGSFVADAHALHDEADKALAREALWKACRLFDRRRFDRVAVADLEEFAVETYAGARSLPEFWGLRWRRRLGPRVCPWLQPFLVSAYVHKVRNLLWWRRFRNFGV